MTLEGEPRIRRKMRCFGLVTPPGEQDDEPARYGQGTPGGVAVLRPGSSVHRFGELASDAADDPTTTMPEHVGLGGGKHPGWEEGNESMRVNAAMLQCNHTKRVFLPGPQEDSLAETWQPD
ncbi:hypothetical protein CDEST_00454 [Colletotrichum destructivum]|uniref:Uncharacterized protein n=1 Tax=Colletotrichum destructivum TaxID=34406 RepID=A0AAX4HWW1_9PEZI|nr:hypothetical protein CDEST_00454 [Colletotrichum destructivum]